MEQSYSSRVTKLSVAARLAVLLGSIALSGATCDDMQTHPIVATCVVDAECAVGICFGGACTTECVADDECASGEFCRSELRSPENDIVDSPALIAELG